MGLVQLTGAGARAREAKRVEGPVDAENSALQRYGEGHRHILSLALEVLYRGVTSKYVLKLGR